MEGAWGSLQRSPGVLLRGRDGRGRWENGREREVVPPLLQSYFDH